MAEMSFDERVRTLKVHPSLPDHRDHWFASATPHLLPPAFDLGVTVPIKDQGQQGSCTGHGFSSMYEALEAIAGKPYVARSRAFIYACERILEHDLIDDAGASPLDGCRTLHHRGVCEEDDMPYDEAVFNLAPSKSQLARAAKNTIAMYARPLNHLAAKEATTLLRPTGFGIAVYASFEKIGSDGIMPMPKDGEELLGGHWVFGNAGGYEDDARFPGGGYFKAQNSWGEDWGDHGYFYVPYAYLDDRNFTFEMRAIR